MLFGLDVLGRRPFLLLNLGRLRSEARLQLRLECEWGTQLEPLFDGLFLGGETDLVLSLVWGLYKSRSRDLHSQCTHNFSITDGPWL